MINCNAFVIFSSEFDFFPLKVTFVLVFDFFFYLDISFPRRDEFTQYAEGTRRSR